MTTRQKHWNDVVCVLRCPHRKTHVDHAYKVAKKKTQKKNIGRSEIFFLFVFFFVPESSMLFFVVVCCLFVHF